MKKLLGRFLLPLLAVGMLGFAIYHVVEAQQKPPKPLPPLEPAEERTVRDPFGRRRLVRGPRLLGLGNHDAGFLIHRSRFPAGDRQPEGRFLLTGSRFSENGSTSPRRSRVR